MGRSLTIGSQSVFRLAALSFEHSSSQRSNSYALKSIGQLATKSLCRRGLLLNSGMRGLRLRRHRFYVRHAAQHIIGQATSDAKEACVGAQNDAKAAEISVSTTGRSRRDIAQKAADDSHAAARMAQEEADRAFTAAKQVTKLLADSVHDIKQLQDTLEHAKSAAKRAMEHKETAAGQAQRALDQVSPRNPRSRLRGLFHGRSQADTFTEPSLGMHGM